MITYARTYSPRPCIKCSEVIAVPHGPQRYCDRCRSTCSVQGCANVVRAKGLCTTHLKPKFAVPSFLPIGGKCGVDGCGRDLRQKGLCAFHYGRAYHYGDVGGAQPIERKPMNVPCSVEGCGKLARAGGFCPTHYARQRGGRDAGGPEALRGALGSGSVRPDGYRVITVGGRSVLEHREVMSKKIGRPLKRSDHVHHLDGDRLNNSPDNLELWMLHHPSGSRASDRVRAAIALLREHHELLAIEGLALIKLESQESTDLLVSEGFTVSESIVGIMGYGR